MHFAAGYGTALLSYIQLFYLCDDGQSFEVSSEPAHDISIKFNVKFNYVTLFLD